MTTTATSPREPTHDPLDLLTLAQVRAITKRGRTALNRDIASGQLRIVRLGRSIRVPRVELERYIREAADPE